MNTVSGIEQTYTHHHTAGGRRGRTMFGQKRGDFLRNHIGTGKKILDIGCRDGELTQEFYKGNKVLGLDIDSKALETLKSNLPEVETKKVDLHADWELPASVFDVVVAGEVLEHLYYPDIVLNKIHSVLKDGGILVGSVPNGFSLINRVRLFLGIKKGTTLHDPTHINHFKRAELAELLSKQYSSHEIVPLGKYAFLDKFWPGMFSFMHLFVARK